MQHTRCPLPPPPSFSPRSLLKRVDMFASRRALASSSFFRLRRSSVTRFSSRPPCCCSLPPSLPPPRSPLPSPSLRHCSSPVRPLCNCAFPQRRPPFSSLSLLSLSYLFVSLRIVCVACPLHRVAIPSTWAPARAGAARLASPLSKPRHPAVALDRIAVRSHTAESSPLVETTHVKEAAVAMQFAADNS